MTTLLIFLVVLGVIVFVHELGHFVVAKCAGVYVDCFSLGFGPRVLGITIGETEYRLSAIPLGGYVRMAGQSDTAEDVEQQAKDRYTHVPSARRFDRKSVPTRMAIIVAGPLMNLLFAVPVVLALLVGGEQQPLPVDATTIGRVLPDSPAALAGLKPGDRILAVNTTPVATWQQWKRMAHNHIGIPLELSYLRRAQTNTVTITPVLDVARGFLGIGVEPLQRAQVAAIMSNTPAAASTLQVGDVIDRLIGVEAHTLSREALIEAIRARPLRPLKLGVKRYPPTRMVSAPFVWSNADVLVTPTRVGRLEHCFVVADVVVVPPGAPSNFPARTGDRLVRINDRAMAPADMDKYIRALPTGSVAVVLERLETIRWRIFKRRVVTSAQLTVCDGGLLGVDFREAEQRVRYPWRAALRQSVVESVQMVQDTLKSFVIIIRERIGIKALSGPVAIARLTGSAAQDGFDVLLRLVLLITVNLGIINLVPLPVLDGGHLLLLGIEGVVRRPLPLKLQVWIQKAGMAVLLALLVFVMYNDILQWLESKESLCVALGSAYDALARLGR
jgi:regulator of sigma E protease